MPKVSVVVVVYNSRKFLQLVFEAIANQTVSDLEIFAVINSSTDGSKEFIQQTFPNVKIIDPGMNTGFAGGNNLAMKQASGEFIQLVNPDLIMSPNYIEKLLPAFSDLKVAAATGKLLRYDFATNTKTTIIDSTGIVMSDSGRARDRGQLEQDNGQYDSNTTVFAVTGAAPMYRKSALESIAFKGEYFDEAFLAYWEDVDLSWRLNNAGLKNVFVPQAVAYHGRTAGQAKGGYFHLLNFISHHRKIPTHIRRLNYKNHILMYLKNTPAISLKFILREIVMFGYVLIFEPSTLGVLPELFRQMKENRAKREFQKLN